MVVATIVLCSGASTCNNGLLANREKEEGRESVGEVRRKQAKKEEEKEEEEEREEQRQRQLPFGTAYHVPVACQEV